MKAVQVRTRITLKNILFATDFSMAADTAAPFAIQMAKSYGAKIYGVHVNRFDDYTSVSPAAWEAMAEAAERETREQAQRLNEQLKGVAHEALLCEGKIWEVLSKLIKEKEIDLLVVGTRGRTGLGKALLGSVAEQILRQAPCPVFTVGPHCAQHLDQKAEMREILYATDLAADLPSAVAFAVSFAQENQSRLTLLHVMEEQKNGEFVHPAELVEAKLSKLRRLVPPEAELWCEPTCLVEQGVAAEQILRAAEIRHADLIVLGARPAKGITTHLHIGTVHNVVARASCPVLTVRC